MNAHSSFTTGFDYLRLFLSIAVLIYHAFGITAGDAFVFEVWTGPWRAIVGCILPIFFALSGFLVAGSLERAKRLTYFVTYRVVRIVPALAAEITLSVLILGPLLTTLTLSEYFTHPDTWRYFWNIVGYIHFHLPGVFEENPRNIVNVSLWTIPYELECYIALFLIAISGLFKKRLKLFFIIIGGTYAATILMLTMGDHFSTSLRPTGLSLVTAFLAGVILYLWRDKIILNWKIFICCLVCLPFLLIKGDFAFLGAFPAAYVAVFLGMFNPPKKEFFMKGDYSYGIYLFAFPIQQLCIQLFPDYNNPLFNIGFSLPIAFICAWFSWHAIENNILKRKKIIAMKVSYLTDTTINWTNKRFKDH